MLCLGFGMSSVCRVLGLLCLRFVVSRVGLSRVGYGTVLGVLKPLFFIFLIFSVPVDRSVLFD